MDGDEGFLVGPTCEADLPVPRRCLPLGRVLPAQPAHRHGLPLHVGVGVDAGELEELFDHLAEALGVGEDGEDVYAWLVARSTRMQERLGPLGVTGYEATPYDPSPLAADPLIVNTLPELRNGWVRPERKDQCEDAMMRYLGLLDEERAGFAKKFINPTIWLGEGIRAALLLPFWTLQWLGVFKEQSVCHYKNKTANPKSHQGRPRRNSRADATVGY